MRRIALLLLLCVGLPAVALLTNVVSADARRGPTIDAHYIARLHEQHGHSQWRNGLGTQGHTWPAYQREAKRLRLYLWVLAVNRHRESLVARWQGVADCESGGNWRTNTGNGHYGGLQFSLRTWQSHGGSGLPSDAPAWRQSEIAEQVRTASGLGAWPHCGQHYG
jgi:hypothetical protein